MTIHFRDHFQVHFKARIKFKTTFQIFYYISEITFNNKNLVNTIQNAEIYIFRQI